MRDWDPKPEHLYPEPESRVQRHPVALGAAQARIAQNVLIS